MSDGQSLTQTNPTTEVLDENSQDPLLMFKQQKWIDFCAVGGLLVGDDGNLTTKTVYAFAEDIKVSRQTLYNWKSSIPNFRERVEQRRIELGGSPARIAKVYNGLFLKAAAGNSEAAKLWLQAFANWKPPKQEVEMDHNFGLADLVAKKKLQIERESKVIDVSTTGSEETNNS